MSAIGQLKVKILDGKGMRVLPMTKSTVTVGRALHCDVVLEHESVQEEHVRAWLEGGRIWVQDLNSTNGTFLNGIRLAPLKPMLVRDIDMLKLGDSPSSIGMEASLVRAPMVKSQPELSEETSDPGKLQAAKDVELEKRRQELAKVSRELAELKLQLQMGRLEKDSTDELRQQINTLREELRSMEEQKEKISEVVRKEDFDKRYQAKMNLALQDLARQLHEVFVSKWRQWATRPLDKDMVKEWEKDVGMVVRRVLLPEGEKPAAEEALTQPHIMELPPPNVNPNNRSAKDVLTGSLALGKSVLQSPRHRPMVLWVSGSMVVLALTLIGFRYYSYAHRTVNKIASLPSAISTSMGSVAPNAQAPTAPMKSKIFKSSYTENVLFTENYVESELNASLRKRWLADLAKVAKSDWRVDEKSLNAIANKELTLIRELQKLRLAATPPKEKEVLAAMKLREAVFQKELLTLLKNQPALVSKYQQMKSGFYSRNISLKDIPRR